MITAIGEVLLPVGACLFVVSIMTYDPPSGYNMGTGDSKIPGLLFVVMGLVGLAMLVWP
jgi:hypothetical protein